MPPRIKNIPRRPAATTLAELIATRGKKLKDLPIPPSRTSEILSGKRSISKSQVFTLAEYFQVPLAVFLEPPPPFPKSTRQK